MIPDIQRILVAVDFSMNSVCALDYAGMLARRCGATIHMLHVCEPMSLGSPALDAAAFTKPDWDKLLADDAYQELGRLAAPFRLLVATKSVLFGDAATCIVREADDRQMDLIVMGTHGRGAVASVLMGSVARHVVRTARCPVLTVRESRETAPVKVAKAPGMLVATAASWIVAFALLAGPTVSAQVVEKDPQQRTSGSEVFRTYCSMCHGSTARGDGPLASSLKRKPANLAEIAMRNGGVFPSDLVFRTIDGRQKVQGHGGPDMPLWGDAFKKSQEGGSESAVKDRISDLVEYIESLQIKLAQ
jgi:nucleotide-binding universal stress UspA family protein